MAGPDVSGAGEWNRFAEGSVERLMLSALSERLGTALRPRVLLLADGVRVEVEGMDAAGTVVAQLVANQGSYKPSYRNKVMADMFKLLWLRTAAPQVERAVLVVSTVTVRALNGWVAVAAADLGVEVYVFDGAGVVPLGAES
ncbi:hypothetical protein [Leifsonia sp. 21MFCrub1.1]|uniref:hypothetical protein n=1 Tax=Leifsonia sp. 21MFCrub1.1 TaxID=1798223 RepID=UPI00089289F6|nr:hypothetical protein [Leifsonia sp. 21MFCrub1.1]SEB10909.1 hypothetical protein SAMN04515680_3333 [Leifsonia sp. 21MFCrub1.1]